MTQAVSPAHGAQVSSEAGRPIARESLWIFALGLLLFTLGLWQQPFIDFESRFALFAQEMWRHGLTLFPTTYTEPYPDYPVTGTVLIWLCSLPFGGVTKFAAVLPTAIAAAFNLVLLYRLLARFSRRWAVMALCLEVMTVSFLAEARSISLDQMLATLTLLAFYLTYLTHTGLRRGKAWLPLLLLAGFAVRGPLGVVIPAGVICAYYAAMREWRLLLRDGVIAAVVLVVAWAALLAVAAKIYGDSFAWDVARMQVFGRLESTGPAQPLYYFFSSFGNYALAYPLAMVVIAAMVPALAAGGVATPRQKMLLGLMVWVAVVLVGLSIPHVKKSRYLLPIVPALAALAAYPWCDASSRPLRYLKYAAERLFLVLPVLLAVALAVVDHRYRHHHGGIRLSLPALYAVLCVAQVAAVWIFFRRESIRGVALAVVAALAMWTVNMLAVEPVLRQAHDTATFVAQVEAIRAQKPAPLVFFGLTRDGEAIKYAVNLPHDFSPVIADDVSVLAQRPRPFYLLARDRNIDAIKSLATPERRVLQGWFDDHAFSLFYFP